MSGECFLMDINGQIWNSDFPVQYNSGIVLSVSHKASYQKAGNPYKSGSLSTIDLLIKIGCFDHQIIVLTKHRQYSVLGETIQCFWDKTRWIVTEYRRF